MEPRAPIGATNIVGTRQKPKRHPEGRVCSHDGCDTRLSVYNKDNRCYVHAPRRRPRIRGRDKPEPKYPRCARCAARARDLKGISVPEVILEDEDIGMVVHREGQEGAATLCEGSVSSRQKRAS